MQHTLEHRIRERAYEIWSMNGRVDGNAVDHWLAAEREMLSSTSFQPTTTKPKGRRKQPRNRDVDALAGAARAA